jgi:2-keto-3-deoxy-L-rhamnonate aldolase RhmA
MNALKRALREGRRAVGCIQLTPSPDVTEILGGAGFDVLMLDHEHGASGLQDTVAQLRALKGTPTAAMVRVPSHEASYVHRLLDLGVDGLVFPNVASADDARAVVALTRYPPRGTRGAGGGLRATCYDRDFAYYERAADDLLVVVQIESMQGVRAIPEITAVAGVDLAVIGPRDLSASLGKLNRFEDPEVLGAFEEAERLLAAGAVPYGSVVYAGMTARLMFERGHRLVLVGTDVALLVRSARAALEGLR